MLSLQTYQNILRKIEAQLFHKDCLQVLAKEFPHVSHGTLLSIYSQHYQLHMKSTHSSHRKPETMEMHYQKYLEISSCEEADQDILLQMAAKASLSPTLFARIILEQFALKKELVPSHTAPSVLVNQWVKAPESIPDVTLQQQVKACILNDANYGPIGENIKRGSSVGLEYEYLLREKIEELNIPFLDEHALRARGYDKTPDFKLEVPIAVDGYILNWIESKASFGDERSHHKYLEEQFWSYQNRFGSGMVIYWFGFIKELNTDKDHGIMLATNFPPQTSIVTIKKCTPT